jgi:hypothetical protein
MVPRSSEIDPWELQLFLVALRDWVLAGKQQMHKSWKFSTAQQALQWHTLAQAISSTHARDCFFDLDDIKSGKIETNMVNLADGHLTREDLPVAIMLNSLEHEIKKQPIDG